MSSKPLIGVLMLDTNFTRIKGDIGNPHTFSFPVFYHTVRGASPGKIVEEQDPSFLYPFIDAARELVSKGVKAITTSCGFLAVFQKELAKNVDVPIFTSSLLQLPWIYSMLQPEGKVGIITANAATLTDKHYIATEGNHIPRVVVGMEDSPAFYNLFVRQTASLDSEAVKEEIYHKALNLSQENPDLKAVVLECTNMPPFANIIKEATGKPVFDIVSLTNWVAQGFYPREFEL